MTKKERVLHAFHNEPVDRVPIAFWYHFSPDDDFGQETIDEHLRLYREADFDLIKVMCDGYFNLIVVFVILKLKILYCRIIQHKPEKLNNPCQHTADHCFDHQGQNMNFNIKRKTDCEEQTIKIAMQKISSGTKRMRPSFRLTAWRTNSPMPSASVMPFSVQASTRIRMGGIISLPPSGTEFMKSLKPITRRGR